MTKILGLDLGANSIGWCLINNELYNSSKNPIIDSGVRVFEGGIQIQGNSVIESKNVERRNARHIRRQYYRKRNRLKILKRTLKEFKFIEDIKEFEDLLKYSNPYEIRKKGLYNELETNNFARALYHIAKHRGYHKLETVQELEENTANNKGEIPSEDGLFENSKLRKGEGEITGIDVTENALKSGQYKTLGEYLSSLDPHQKRLRSRYLSRRFLVDEFNSLWEKQKSFNKKLYTDKAKSEIYNALFFRNKLKSQKHKLGKCKFEPNRTKVLKSNPFFQEFRMLQSLNILEFKEGNRIIDNPKLSNDERTKLIKLLSNKESQEFKPSNRKYELFIDLNLTGKNRSKFNKYIQKEFGLGEEDNDFKFNLDKLFTLDTKIKIESIFNRELSEEKLDEIYQILIKKDDNNWLKKYAIKKWGLSEEQAIKLTKVHLENGYSDLSLKAIKKILPYLREGCLYNIAMEKAGYTHNLYKKNELLDALVDIPKGISNPVVTVALHQLRKIVNNVIITHGRPDKIRVEIARELKKGKKKIEEYLKQQTKNEEENRIAVSEIIKIKVKNNIKNPNSVNKEEILKYRLWKESKEKCAYSNKAIGCNILFTNDIEIDHIIPYSWSMDNSFMNKTICYAEENRKKSNKTPLEYYSMVDINKWQDIKTHFKKYIPHKYDKINASKINFEKEGDFTVQHLNDTKYISKLAMHWLKNICKEVYPLKGATTAYIRDLWELNGVLPQLSIITDILPFNNKKNRLDHRHHLVDAIVVALTDAKVLKNANAKLKDYEKLKLYKVKNINDHLNFPKPWSNFINDINEVLENTIISHKVKTKRKGKLHEETFYGQKIESNGDINYYYKKEGKKKIVTKGKNSMYKIASYNKYVLPQNNFSCIVFINENGEKQIEILRLIDVVKWNKFNKESIKNYITTKYGENCEFISTLKENELIYLGKELPSEFIFSNKWTYNSLSDNVWRLRKMSKKDYTFNHHTIAKTDINVKVNNNSNKVETIKIESSIHRFRNDKFDFIKLKIDENGYLTLADD